MSNTQRSIFRGSEIGIEWAGLEHGTWCRRILKGFFLVFFFLFHFSFVIGLVVGKRFRFRISFENLLQMMSSLPVAGEFFGYSIFDIIPFVFML